jgi:hypothetical protein
VISLNLCLLFILIFDKKGFFVILEYSQPITTEISNHHRIEKNNEIITENRDNIFRKKNKAKGKNSIIVV